MNTACVRRAAGRWCIALLLAVALYPSRGSAQWLTDPDFDLHTKQGIDHVYNLEFDAAEADFHYIVATYPNHPAGYFFLAMVDWWKILLDMDDESHDDAFLAKLNVVIDKCDSILDVNPDDVTALFFKGGALGFRGRLRANRNNWIRAANDGRLALPIVQHAFKIAPDNYDILLGIGIYNYYAEAIPEQYPIVKPLMLFFPSGDKKKGIEQLQEAAAHAKYAAVEAEYFLLQLNYTHEKKYDKALEIAKRLFARYPRNVVFHRYIGRCYVSLGKWDSAEVTFKEVLSRCDGLDGPMAGYTDSAKREALYYLGVYAMNTTKYIEALKDLYQCDEVSRKLDKEGESGFMVMANLRIGFVYDLQMKRDLAIAQYNKVLGMKKFENSYDLAEQYIKSPYPSK
ncbi:MAG TPA: tetratricopeptide repeat protein [Bacteroidota bacterium]|nr:tetratricopeptide repeat protein [Bacteroidota bacterium]